MTGWRRTIGIVTALAVVVPASPHIACAQGISAHTAASAGPTANAVASAVASDEMRDMDAMHAMHQMDDSSPSAAVEVVPSDASSTGCDDPGMGDHCLQHCTALAIPPLAVASVASAPPGARALSAVAQLTGIPTPADSPPPKR